MSEKGSSQSTSSSSSKKFKDLIAFFSHPLVGILGSISGIIGIPLAIYFTSRVNTNRDLLITFIQFVRRWYRPGK